MKFTEIGTLQAIQGYSFADEMFLKKDGGLCRLKFPEEQKLLPKVSDYQIHENKIYYQEENLKDIFVFDLRTEKISRIEGSFTIGSRGLIFGRKGFYTIGIVDGSKKLFEIDDSLSITLCTEYNFHLPVMATDDGVLFKKRGQLMNINVHERREVWSYSLPNADRIADVYLAREMLVIQSNTNNLFGIGKDAGQKHWELANVSYYHSYDPNTELLYSFGGETYTVIDPQQGKILKEKTFKGAEQEYQIAPSGHMHSCSNGHLYFMSNRHGPRFGAVNIETGEIVCVQQLSVEDDVKGDIPHYHQGRLYIGDSSDRLHVFETQKGE